MEEHLVPVLAWIHDYTTNMEGLFEEIYQELNFQPHTGEEKRAMLLLLNVLHRDYTDDNDLQDQWSKLWIKYFPEISVKWFQQQPELFQVSLSPEEHYVSCIVV